MKFHKVIETITDNQIEYPELKNRIIETKKCNSFNSNLNQVKERINNLQTWWLEISQLRGTKQNTQCVLHCAPHNAQSRGGGPLGLEWKQSRNS